MITAVIGILVVAQCNLFNLTSIVQRAVSQSRFLGRNNKKDEGVQDIIEENFDFTR